MSWMTVLKLLLKNPKVRKMIFTAVAATLCTFFLFVYAIFAAPWAIMSSFFQTLFGGGVNWDEAYAAESQESYIEEYKKFAGNPGNNPPINNSYTSILQGILEDALEEAIESAKDAAESYSDNSLDNVETGAIVYTSFTDTSGASVLDPSDAGLILSMYNNVGWNWDWYKENKPDVLDDMEVPKMPDGTYVEELASVDMEKLLKLINKNKEGFFVIHVPQSDGTCSLGGACTLNHVNGIHDCGDEDSVPTTYFDLLADQEEPYVGIYYATWEEDVSDDDEPEDIESFGLYVGVAFIEYRGFEFFQERLSIHEGTQEIEMVSQAFSNLLDILGESSLTGDSTAMAAALIEHSPIDTTMMFSGFTSKPIVNFPGNYISAAFNDPYYFSQLGYVHWGIDISGPGVSGKSIYPLAKGEIARITKSNQGFGNHVVVYHGKDASGNRYYVIYAHMSSINPNISVGQKVFTGTRLGYVGRSGNSTGPHLHAELQIIHPDGSHESVNPTSYGFDLNWYVP